MSAMDKEHPNWLFRGMVAVSVGVHILVLLQITGPGGSTPSNYIELEIRADDKPVARNIPVPTRRKAVTSRSEIVAAFTSEPVRVPSIIAAPEDVIQKPSISTPQIISWEHDLTTEEPVSTTALITGIEDNDASGEIQEKYYRKVLEKIEKNRKYPYAARKMKVKGRALVRFVIETDGTARDAEIAESTGNRLLDKAALSAVTSSSPFPEPPPEVFSMAVPLEVNVVFKLNK